ncbi:hypothetical protein NLU13_4360 [Sarocladium strictum]|uniref:Protein YOP1 n=1 Tax=Sarocladium strictum TaxID=5046 RepID=A0AA39GJ30_SARSR|nr:hypothetical protein NLU13_4360 [Sarocladium strictum]
MFDLFAMVLSSLASFLFPIFASYKALKTSDPAQLTPWLMYWVVFSCCLLVESWVNFILTQGARIIYEEHIHPFLQDNEAHIDEFIANAHDRLRTAGVAYIKQAIEYVKTQVLGFPPTEPTPEPAHAQGAPQSYTQSLLARFSVPTARWAGSSTSAATATGNDFYNLLASAVSAATAAATTKNDPASASGPSLIPASLQDSREKMTFIAAQRERLNILLSALDREAQDIEQSDSTGDANTKAATPPDRASRSMAFDGNEDEEPTQRPPSGLSMWSALSKSRSEVDFEKIEAESGAEDEDGSLRRRRGKGGKDDVDATPSATTGSWMPWGWGGTGAGAGAGAGGAGASSGVQQ